MRSLALGLSLVLAPPEYDPDLPYESQRPTYRLAEPDPPPPRGNAALGFGITGVAFGALLIAGGIPLVGVTDADFVALTPIGFGVGFVVLGTVGIIVGKRRRAAWKRWASEHPSELAPRTKPGTPQLIIGTTTFVAGTVTMIPTGVMLANVARPEQPSFVGFMTAWASSSILTGVALIVDGSVRRHRHVRSERHRATLTPTGWASREGSGFGVAGRF
jgi:hypothetical protein